MNLSLHKLNFLLCQRRQIWRRRFSQGSAVQFGELILKCNIVILLKQDVIQYATHMSDLKQLTVVFLVSLVSYVFSQ